MPIKQRHKQILSLGLPLSAGMVSQSILSLVDTAMIASLDNANALAAVGIASYATFLAVAMVLGLSIGVQALVARRIGSGDRQHFIEALHAGIILAGGLGLFLTAFFYSLAPWLVSLINGTAEVVEIGTDYLRYRILGICFIGINFAFRGFWNGIHDSASYIRILLLVHICNFLISYCLIFGAFGAPEMGAPGSGLGTTLSILIGTIAYLFLTYRHQKKQQLPFWQKPDRPLYGALLKLAIPNSLQQFFLALAISSLYFIIGLVSVEALAVGHAIINISLFIILPGNGLAQAATTLVSRALGEKNTESAKRWGWETAQVSVPVLFLLGLPLVIFPEQIIHLFVPDDPALRELARFPVQMAGAMAIFQSIIMSMSQALLGAGDNKRVMLLTTASQWLVMLPLAWFIGIWLGYGLDGIWVAQFIERVITSLLFMLLWHHNGWMNIKLEKHE